MTAATFLKLWSCALSMALRPSVNCHKKAGMPPGIPAQSTSRSAAHHGETSRKKPAAFVPSVFV
jgi:hypothetical protein